MTLSQQTPKRVSLRQSAGLAALFLAATTTGQALANDTILVDGQGFEAPDYFAGALAGQVASTFDGLSSAAWITFPSPTGGTAEVQSAVVNTGSQALEVNRAANSDDRWTVPVTGAPTERYVVVSWDMRVEQSTSSQFFGPFFGVETFNDNPSVGRSASLGVDSTTGDVLFTQRDDGVLPGFLVESGTQVQFGEWNEFAIVLDFDQDMSLLYLNDSLLLMTPFEQDGIDGFSDADITAIAAGADAAEQAATGTAFFDNFLVIDTNDFTPFVTEPVIPEPASIALLGLGGLLAAHRRR